MVMYLPYSMCFIRQFCQCSASLHSKQIYWTIHIVCENSLRITLCSPENELFPVHLRTFHNWKNNCGCEINRKKAYSCLKFPLIVLTAGSKCASNSKEHCIEYYTFRISYSFFTYSRSVVHTGQRPTACTTDINPRIITGGTLQKFQGATSHQAKCAGKKKGDMENKATQHAFLFSRYTFDLLTHLVWKCLYGELIQMNVTPLLLICYLAL